MRFGVCLPNYPFGAAPSPDGIVEVAREAERLGFDSLWATDHLLVPTSMPRYHPIFESLSTLAYLGGATSSIALGTSVLVLPMRHAIVTGKQAATIDALTGGRLLLGMGVGYAEGEYANLGAGFRDRGRHMDEAIAVMRALWSQERPRFQGERYRFEDALFGPAPARPGGVPIWIGGNSGAALSRAARLGDGWHADGLPVAELAPRVERLRALTPAGREVAVTMRRAVDLRPGAGASTDEEAIGSGEVPLRGADATRAELAELERIGLDHLVCQFEHETLEEHLDQLRRFAAEVMPAKRRS